MYSALLPIIYALSVFWRLFGTKNKKTWCQRVCFYFISIVTAPPDTSSGACFETVPLFTHTKALNSESTSRESFYNGFINATARGALFKELVHYSPSLVNICIQRGIHSFSAGLFLSLKRRSCQKAFQYYLRELLSYLLESESSVWTWNLTFYLEQLMNREGFSVSVPIHIEDYVHRAIRHSCTVISHRIARQCSRGDRASNTHCVW